MNPSTEKVGDQVFPARPSDFPAPAQWGMNQTLRRLLSSFTGPGFCWRQSSNINELRIGIAYSNGVAGSSEGEL